MAKVGKLIGHPAPGFRKIFITIGKFFFWNSRLVVGVEKQPKGTIER